MKRYRYGNPASQSVLQRFRPYILIFVGWNLAGAVLWKFANSRAEQKDPDWYSKSETDRIATLSGNKPETAKKYSFSLTSKNENGDNSNS